MVGVSLHTSILPLSIISLLLYICFLFPRPHSLYSYAYTFLASWCRGMISDEPAHQASTVPLGSTAGAGHSFDVGNASSGHPLKGSPKLTSLFLVLFLYHLWLPVLVHTRWGAYWIYLPFPDTIISLTSIDWSLLSMTLDNWRLYSLHICHPAVTLSSDLLSLIDLVVDLL